MIWRARANLVNMLWQAIWLAGIEWLWKIHPTYSHRPPGASYTRAHGYLSFDTGNWCHWNDRSRGCDECWWRTAKTREGGWVVGSTSELLILVGLLFILSLLFWFLLLQKVAILHVLLKGQLMYCIQVVSSGVTRWYVLGAGGPNHYRLCRPLYGLDDCLYRVKVKVRWSMPIPRLLQLEWGYCWHFWIVMFLECYTWSLLGLVVLKMQQELSHMFL